MSSILAMLKTVDWQALATFSAGAMAVGAALFVGKKQTDIQNSQLEIQRRQTQLTENDLKIQLLEKRSLCVAKMREVLACWTREARLNDEQMKVFVDLLQDTELLYPQEFHIRLNTAVSAAWGHIFFAKRANQAHDRGQHDKAKEYLEKSFAEEDSLFESMPELLKDIIDKTRVDAWE